MAVPIPNADWLVMSNPWWGNPGAIDSDEHIRKWDASRARHVPPLFRDIRDSIDSDDRILYTVHGSRQVGKTTLAKLLIRDLLAGGVRPGNMCYFALDPRLAAMDLVQVILDYVKMARQGSGDDRLYIFIDEISLSMGWQYAILSLCNVGALPNCALVVTGSNAMDLTRGTESLVGRKGMVPGGSHRSMLPMGFLDFVCLEHAPLRKFLDLNSAFAAESRSAMWKDVVEGRANAALGTLCMKSGDLDAVLHKYVMLGGIPCVVNEYLGTGSVPDRYYAEYLRSIKYEWSRMKYGTDHLKRCMEFIINETGSTIAWNGMAKKIDVSNSTVAENYTTSLRDMYLALITHFYDVRHDSEDATKLKKVHVRDPFFFHAFNSWHHNEGYFYHATKYVSDKTNFGRLVECAMADHLARHAIAVSTDKSQFDVPARLFHWRNRAGREVDFVYRDPERSPVPIEVKCSGRVDRRRLGGISGFLDASGANRGVVATRTEYDVGRDYTLVPASVLLLLLS